jgi:tRNA-modifying protein YgfZ
MNEPVDIGAVIAKIRPYGALVPEHVFAPLLLKGKDTRDLLHRLSTNDVRELHPDVPVGTVLVNERGRIIDWVECVLLPEGLCVLCHAPARATVKEWIEKFIFSEDVEIAATTSSLSVHSLILPYRVSTPEGTERVDSLTQIGLDAPSWETRFGPFPMLRVLAGPTAALTDAFTILRQQGVAELTSSEYQAIRVAAKVPSNPEELNDGHNPLESGLRSNISFTKGCYIGQEVIARLDSYDKVRKELVLLEVADANVAVGATVLAEGREAGSITSIGGRIGSGRGLMVMGYLDRGIVGTGGGLAISTASGSVSVAVAQPEIDFIGGSGG